MVKKIMSKRRRVGGARGSRARRDTSPIRDLSISRSRTRSRSRSRTRSRSRSKTLRGKTNIITLRKDLENGINWLLGNSSVPESGPNLSININPIKTKITKATYISLNKLWDTIMFAKQWILAFIISFEKVKSLLYLAKQILLYSKVFISVIPVDVDGENKLKNRYVPSPSDYQSKIDTFKVQIKSIEESMQSIDDSYGKVHKSDKVSSLYQSFSDDLTSLVEEMTKYIDENKSIIYASPPPSIGVTIQRSQSAIKHNDINTLVRTIT